MLDSVSLSNFRAYESTGEVKLNKLNIFLGANNAGKSSFSSAVEIFFRSYFSRGEREPLPFSQMPSLSTFDSVLRQHWGPNAARPKAFVLGFNLTAANSSAKVSLTYSRDPGDGSPVADTVEYDLGTEQIVLSREKKPGSKRYSLKMGGKATGYQDLIFNGLLPYSLEFEGDSRLWMDLRQKLVLLRVFRDHRPLEIVSPSRPVPRAIYVLDDPNLGVDDRDLVAYLTQLFSSTEAGDIATRERIKEHLSTLGLATDFTVSSVSKKTASKIVSLRIAPKTKRQQLTIADVGFGASQVLPLLVKDARLEDGVLIAYQPEVHLHPFAQARLADIFVASVKRGNQIFVETHSQDLILRLQLLMSEGAISPEDVTVFCFENKSSGSTIRPINFKSGGVPEVHWPAGFLDTSIDLARRIAASRVKSLPPVVAKRVVDPELPRAVKVPPRPKPKSKARSK